LKGGDRTTGESNPDLAGGGRDGDGSGGDARTDSNKAKAGIVLDLHGNPEVDIPLKTQSIYAVCFYLKVSFFHLTHHRIFLTR
jgi:hypothetical protein